MAAKFVLLYVNHVARSAWMHDFFVMWAKDAQAVLRLPFLAKKKRPVAISWLLVLVPNAHLIVSHEGYLPN